MMSKKQLACMLALHIVYLFVGASIFYHIESPVELENRAEEKLERLEIQNLLYENYIPNDPAMQDVILKKLSAYCGKNIYNYTTEDEEPPYKWDFYHSFFFSYTVVSTIGYGNLAPTTHLSRILMIFYGLFGIPINGILLANLGEYFGLQLITVIRKYKKRSGARRAKNLDYIFSNLGMLGQIFLYLVPGFLFFIFLPACIFVVFEGWDYVASIYYAFVTLTTIGFGDLVAGTVNNGFKYGYFFTYQIFLVIWITFGLGYIVMLLGFITSGMRSEGVHRLEQKLANQFKKSQNRILQGFTKDIAVIRKIINEANLVKIKPVYVDYPPQLYKSASCPSFTFDIEPRGPIVKRKRANSENIHISAKDMLRIQSDTDLLGIDKEKTFGASALVKPAELLARVVNVLGGLEPPPPQDKGVHMFEDEQILASEKPPIFSIGNEVITNSPKRNRALSVAVPNYRKDSVTKPDDNGTWTQGEVENNKNEANVRSGKLSLPCNFIPELEEQPKPTNLLSKLFHKNQGSDNVTSNENFNEKAKRRGSIFPTFGFGEKEEKNEEEDMAKAYREQTKKGRRSIFPTFDFSEDEDTAAVKAYQSKTKRHSIFPTFDFSEDEEDESRAYREKTKAGRRSIFPTFNFDEEDDDGDDDDIDEEELRRYQNRTNKGRMSLFPTFGKNKNKDQEPRKPNSAKGEMSDLEASIRQFQSQVQNQVQDSSDDVESYMKKTKKGRLSLFPTFGKDRKNSSANDDVSDLEASIRQFQNSQAQDSSDEIENYKKKTKKGRGSLFPSFGKDRKNSSAKDDVSDLEASIKHFQNQDQESSDDAERYLKKTKKGRLSLFPTFGKDRKNSAANEEVSDLEASIRQFQKGRGSETNDTNFDADLERYRDKTKRGRGSLFDPSVDIETMPKSEQVQALEETSVADLIRALTMLETAGQGQTGPRPGILELLAGGAGVSPMPTAVPSQRRRGSIRPADFVLPPIPARKVDSAPSKAEHSPTKLDFVPTAPSSTPSILHSIIDDEKDSTVDVQPRRRRVSARAGAPQFTPSLPTVMAGTELQITTATAARENRMSMMQPPPPYTETAEEPQQRKVRRYSPAPGDHSRPSTGPVPRLFSRMRRDSPNSNTPPDGGSPRRGSLTEIVIDNDKDKIVPP